MKSLIVYFSFSGNTRKVAQELALFLGKAGSVDTVELKNLNETGNFFKQGSSAFKHERADIGDIDFDVAAYDLICIGTPVWAFTATPAINTYLDKCKSCEGKRVLLFTTSGGSGDKRCINYMKEVLASKGVKDFKSLSISQNKIKNKEFILFKINEALPLWPNG